MKSVLIELFKKYDIKISDGQIEKLCKLYELVLCWNQNINLTSITEKNDFAVLHLLDSIICLDFFKNVKKVVDIGTGAGFPAFPLAILLPNIEFTLVDSINKKTNFHNLVIKELKLENVKAVNARIEGFAKKNFEMFDVVTARAVAKMPTLLEYAMPLLKINGMFLAYKSQQVEQEIQDSKKALEILGGKFEKDLNFEFENLKRKIILVKKIKNTPKIYPREQNKPRTKPL